MHSTWRFIWEFLNHVGSFWSVGRVYSKPGMIFEYCITLIYIFIRVIGYNNSNNNNDVM